MHPLVLLRSKTPSLPGRDKFALLLPDIPVHGSSVIRRSSIALTTNDGIIDGVGIALIAVSGVDGENL